MRLMAVSLTEDAVRDRSKTVTRRAGWRHAEPGMLLCLCRKVMGRRRRDGTVEPLVRIVVVEVVAVTFERLDTVTQQEVDREGLPHLDPAGFVEFWTAGHKGTTAATVVTRLEWRYREDLPVEPDALPLEVQS